MQSGPRLAVSRSSIARARAGSPSSLKADALSVTTPGSTRDDADGEAWAGLRSVLDMVRSGPFGWGQVLGKRPRQGHVIRSIHEIGSSASRRI